MSVVARRVVPATLQSRLAQLGVAVLSLSLGSCGPPPHPCDVPIGIGTTVACIAAGPPPTQTSGQRSPKPKVQISAEQLERLGDRAIQGDPEAQYHLGLYMFEKDKTQSFAWLCRAAMQRWYDAQIAVGTFHEYGIEPIEPDYVKAMMWYILASPARRQPAKTLADEMTPPQIAHAEQMAREWKSEDCPSVDYPLPVI